MQSLYSHGVINNVGFRAFLCPSTQLKTRGATAVGVPSCVHLRTSASPLATFLLICSAQQTRLANEAFVFLHTLFSGGAGGGEWRREGRGRRGGGGAEKLGQDELQARGETRPSKRLRAHGHTLSFEALCRSAASERRDSGPD